MHRRVVFLHLGQDQPWAQLERRRDIEGRPRTDYGGTVRDRASSDLHRTPGHDRRDRDRPRARRWNHRVAVRVLGTVDQTPLRRETHAPEISGRIRGLSAARKTTYTFRSL